MPFDVLDPRKAWHRSLSERDGRVLAKCVVCRHRDLCGGMRVRDDSRFCDEICMACRAICCHTDRAETEIARVGGLDFFEPWKPFAMLWSDVVWSVTGDAGRPREAAFIVAIDTILDHRTRGWPQDHGLRRRFGVPDGATLGLSFCWKDWLLDWLREDEDGVWDRIAEYRELDYCLAPNWSTYDNHPRVDQLVAMKSRFRSMQKMQDRGLRVVPDLAWNTGRDVDRMVEWCRVNRVHMVHVNVQTIRRRSEREWVRELELMWRMLDEIAADQPLLRILVTGLGRTRAPWFLRRAPAPVTVINASAWVSADLGVDLEKRGYRDLGWDRARLFALNRQQLRAALKGAVHAG